MKEENKMSEEVREIDRRKFLATAGIGATALGLGMSSMLTPGVASADTKTIEEANEKLVLDMCKKIETVDPAQIAPYMAEGFEFQLIDGQPIIKGKEAFMAFVGMFFAAYESAEFIVHRSTAMGNLVLTERTDNFKAKEGGTDASFHVTGFCVVKDGLIHEWKDYGVPE